MADKKDVDELASSSSLASPPPQQQQQRPTTLNDLQHDVLVSIFSIIDEGYSVWITETFPLVCRAWRDLYRRRQASPLHENLVLDLRFDRAPWVLAWARRYAADVTQLGIRALPSDAHIRDFTEEALAELVSVVGPHFLSLIVLSGFGSLLRDRFWGALRDAVVPDARLQKLAVEGIRAPLPDSFAKSLARCTSLEGLKLWFEEEGPNLDTFAVKLGERNRRRRRRCSHRRLAKTC